MMKKSLALLLAVLMLICTIGCGEKKSTEMTLNDGILENDYFSIDVSGYEDIRTEEEKMATKNDNRIGEAYAMIVPHPEGGKSTKQYVLVRAFYDTKNETIRNEAYFELDIRSRGGELLEFEYISDNAISYEALYLEDDGYYYNSFFFIVIDDLVFSITVGDIDGTEERFEGYTTAIDSFKLK